MNTRNDMAAFFRDLSSGTPIVILAASAAAEVFEDLPGLFKIPKGKPPSAPDLLGLCGNKPCH
jgi:hypothetical protein